MYKHLDSFIGIKVDDPLKVIKRLSIRAVVRKEGKYLMLASDFGDYQFPGGGVEPGETHREAAIRELKEETGYVASSKLDYIGRVVTCRLDKFEEGFYYENECMYFACDVLDEPGELKLTETEARYHCHPVWVTKDEIMMQNQDIHQKDGQRDVWCLMVEEVLEYIDEY